MIDPTRLLSLTPLNAENEENILELDAELVIGWMGYPKGSVVYIHGFHDHGAFSVKETVEQIKKQINSLREIADPESMFVRPIEGPIAIEGPMGDILT